MRYDALNAAFKYKNFVGLVVAASVVTALVAILLTPPAYTARTKLLVRMGREKFSALSTDPMRANVLFQEREQNVNDEIEILTDPNLMTAAFVRLKAALPQAEETSRTGFWGFFKTMAKALGTLIHTIAETLKSPFYALGLARPLTDDERILRDFNHALHVGYVKATDIVDVDFTWSDSAFAAKAANLVVDAYREQHVKVFAATGSVADYRQKLDGLRETLAGIDAAIARLLKTSDRASFDVEQQLDLTAIAELQRQREALQLGRQQMALALDRLTGILQRTDGRGVDWIDTPPDAASPALQGLDLRYAALDGRRAELATRFTSKAPERAANDAALKRLARQKADALIAYDFAQMRILNERIAGITRRIEAQHGEIVGLTADQLAYQRLLADRRAAQQRVDETARTLSGLEANSALDDKENASFATVSSAEPPAFESGLPKLAQLAIAAVLGVLAGLAVVAGREALRDTMRDGAEAENDLRVPVLASVPDAG